MVTVRTGARGKTRDRAAVVVEGVVGWSGEVSEVRGDVLTAEEPLEIRLAGWSVAVTMRTPGDDFDLATGYLFTEGIIHGAEDIAAIAYCPAENAESEGNIVNVNPVDPSLVNPERWQRNFFMTSSCGICGKASIETVRQHAPPIRSDVRVSPAVLSRLGATLREAQTEFSRTGGLHAAGLFDLQGRLRAVREDVGRHNAVDKVIGDALRRGALPLDETILMVSGRSSFEIVQKALMAHIPVLAAVSAPSSLAVELARDVGMTLVGFLRGAHFNVYAGTERVSIE